MLANLDLGAARPPRPSSMRFVGTARTPILILILTIGVVLGAVAAYTRVGSDGWDRDPITAGTDEASLATQLADRAFDTQVPASIARGSVLSCWKASEDVTRRADVFFATQKRPASTYADLGAGQVPWLDAGVQARIERFEPGCELAAPRALLAVAEQHREAALRERAELDEDRWVARGLMLACLFAFACWATRAATNVRLGRGATVQAFLGWVPWWVFVVLAIALPEDGGTRLTTARWVLPLATVGVPLILVATRRPVGRIIWEGGGLPLRWVSIAYWLPETLGYLLIFGAASWYVGRDHDVYGGSLGDGPQKGFFEGVTTAGVVALGASLVLVAVFMIAASIGQHIMIVRERKVEAPAPVS